MPYRIIPPGSAPESRISTSWPSRARWYAAESPLGPAPITSTRLPVRTRRRVEPPALLEREVAEEPLDRVDRDGAVEVGAVADALARVVADPSVDRGQRIVRDELAPRLLVPARLGVRRARPGCSRRPGSRRCTAAAGRRRRVAARGPGRCANARAAGPAAASRPASSRSRLWPRSDDHRPQANALARHSRPDNSTGIWYPPAHLMARASSREAASRSQRASAASHNVPPGTRVP